MKSILVAGDVCLDVVGITIPPPSSIDGVVDNWRLTGETRTHYLRGGALLVADWVRAATREAVPAPEVFGPRPCKPAALSCGDETDQPLTPGQLLELASRLTRDEIVHSLLNLDYFRDTPKADDANRIRVERMHGFSGPQQGDPSLKLLPPETPKESPDFLVLDDTGNRFRRSPSQWPIVIKEDSGAANTVVVYKLHRPLPSAATTVGAESVSTNEDGNARSLWDTVAQRYPERRLVIVSIDDLRDKDAPISRGLSWERTALDLVWQLLNVEAFAALRDCPHLIVRMGLDGVLYWHHCPSAELPYNAWLIYDPTGIEGTGETACDGQMVGYGSAFTAALVQQLAKADSVNCLTPSRHKKGNVDGMSDSIEAGVKAGLVATRRLLRMGFGTRANGEPRFPSSELFTEITAGDPYFACQRIPIIPRAATPDRGYWRLLDSIFDNKTTLLHRAVALKATGAKAVDPQDQAAEALLRQVPTAVFAKALRTSDRREIENYRALYSLMLDYVRQPTPPRPLSVAVFGPPGAGKSFGVKHVAKALGQIVGSQPIKSLTFNLSQYQSPDQLADAFHLVRDLVLQGNVPLVFFDEFDTSLGGVPLGWLRYFLAPMQDAEFLDRGTPHPIGKSIFVFAGGTCSTYAEFAAPLKDKPGDNTKEDDLPPAYKRFKSAKGPDFLSRLRGTLDVPGLDLNTTFDPFGPVESFPCEAAILLRRAGILAHQLGEKAPRLLDSAKKLRVSPTVLRALLHLPQFEHGNRSLEALLDMSHLPDAERFTPSLLPSTAQTGLHADSGHLGQLLATEYPFPPEARETIAIAIHKRYVEQRKKDPEHDPNDPALKEWSELAEDLRNSNREQADHIAIKLRAAGLWFRKIIPRTVPATQPNHQLETMLETLAKSEHNRWVAEKRRQGWIAARDTARTSRNNGLRLHNFLFPWEELTDELKELDREPVRRIPDALAAAGYEVFKP